MNAGSGVPQKEPFFLSPDQRVGHLNLEVWTDSQPRSDRNAHIAPHCHFLTRAQPQLEAEEIVPEIKLGLNPHVGLAQGYQSRNMKDP
jgi:hypothetical protein